MKMKLDKIVEHISAITIVITAILIIVLNILHTFNVFEGWIYYGTSIVFYVSLSALLLRVFFQQNKIGTNTDDIKNKSISNAAEIKAETMSLKDVVLAIDSKANSLLEEAEYLKKSTAFLHQKIKLHDSIVFPKHGSSINTRIEEIINSNIASRVKIICYGTSKFGQIIDHIINYSPDTQLDIIVCSPLITILDCDSDKLTLIKNIKDMLKASNVNLSICSVPPTIRACSIYDKSGNPIWCSIQPYYIFKDSTRLFRGESFSPAMVADNESDILAELAVSFNSEFERLLVGYCELVTLESFTEIAENLAEATERCD